MPWAILLGSVCGFQEGGAQTEAVLRIPRASRQWALHSILQLAFHACA